MAGSTGPGGRRGAGSAQAAKILDGALARVTDASTVERVEALAYGAELALALQDPDRAAGLLAELDGIRCPQGTGALGRNSCCRLGLAAGREPRRKQEPR
ncbi:hypothetical protein [Pseudarthrobacter sp. H2]|uniref:hypothetical protein n=1 Tax=Pseudarthrobacter sp. H2 TaxID=3418415 RepID=UPI003CF51809